MSRAIFRSGILAVLMIGCLALTALAATEPTHEEGISEPDVGTASKAELEKVHPTKAPYSPYAGRNFPTRPLFGDTHLHTAFSMDAGAFGCRLGPQEAYRFARGDQINS